MKEILNLSIFLFSLLSIISGCSYYPTRHADSKPGVLADKLRDSTSYRHLWEEHDEIIREFN